MSICPPPAVFSSTEYVKRWFTGSGLTSAAVNVGPANKASSRRGKRTTPANLARGCAPGRGCTRARSCVQRSTDASAANAGMVEAARRTPITTPQNARTVRTPFCRAPLWQLSTPSAVRCGTSTTLTALRSSIRPRRRSCRSSRGRALSLRGWPREWSSESSWGNCTRMRVRQLGTDLNRDSLAKLMIERGAQPVRQVAIDDVWSALRFRPGS